MSTDWTCGRCGAATGEGARQCPQCLVELDRTRCRNCGAVGPHHEFVNGCPYCAAGVTQTAICDHCDRMIDATARHCPFCKQPRALSDNLLRGETQAQPRSLLQLLLAGVLLALIAGLLVGLLLLG